MVTSRGRILLPISVLVGLWGLIVFARDKPAELPGCSWEESKARAMLVAWLCTMYETDKGRFPVSQAELHWPIDYTEFAEKKLGFDFGEANKDPIANGRPFLIRPIVDREKAGRYGIGLRGEGVEWWVISAAGPGSFYLDVDIIYSDSLPPHQSYLESSMLDSGILYYIKDEEIREIVAGEEVGLSEVIRAAFPE